MTKSSWPWWFCLENLSLVAQAFQPIWFYYTVPIIARTDYIDSDSATPNKHMFSPTAHLWDIPMTVPMNAAAPHINNGDWPLFCLSTLISVADKNPALILPFLQQWNASYSKFLQFVQLSSTFYLRFNDNNISLHPQPPILMIAMTELLWPTTQHSPPTFYKSGTNLTISFFSLFTHPVPFLHASPMTEMPLQLQLQLSLMTATAAINPCINLARHHPASNCHLILEMKHARTINKVKFKHSVLYIHYGDQAGCKYPTRFNRQFLC